MGFPEPLTEIETKVANYSKIGFYTHFLPLENFLKDKKKSDKTVRIYMTGDLYVSLIGSIKSELIRLLLNRLPSV